jgi:HAD superfamily hydrolase (TIGR01662 family)
MGRYKQYFEDIWKLQAKRKTIAISLFGVLFDNSKPFTPGNQLAIADGAELGLQMLAQKGYDILIITGQPPSRTKSLEIDDFENILGAAAEICQKLGCSIKNAYYAPSTDKTDPFVKPNIGMFERAQKENNLNWADMFYVGVESNDIKAASKVSAKPVIIKSIVNKDVKFKALELTNNIKVQEYDSLADFASILPSAYE